MSEEFLAPSAEGLPTWTDLQLHDWLCLARKYGAPRPSSLQRGLREYSDREREQWMRRALQLVDATERDVYDRWNNRLTVNDRIVKKTLLKPDRTPYVAWVQFAVARALEVWEKPVDNRERRRYYLAAITAPQKDAVLAIVGEDGVIFNVFQVDPSYVARVRNGKLLHRAYDDDGRYCSAHGCCDDVVRLERQRDTALRERDQLRDRLRAKKRANPPK